MQEKEFTSGALRVNLEETRIKDIEIPEHHQEIIICLKITGELIKERKVFLKN